MIIIKILSFILFAMTTQAFSQDHPAGDIISTDAGDVEMHFIGHGSLMFQVNDFRIYIDPVRSIGNYDISKKADLILVTHEHSDHLDPELIEDLRKPGTIVMVNKNTASRVKGAKALEAGDVENINDIIVEAVPAYNIVNMRSPGQPFHPKGVGNGYILTIGNKRIYIAGDTENIPEMKALKDIYVAFLPMNLPYTMTPEMVADAALAFKPHILYPYHYSNTNTDELVKLLKDNSIEVRIRNLQ